MTFTKQDETDRLYTLVFFQVFAATGVFMTGVALQFHFGQYVGHLGYGVDTLGRILSLGVIGTLCSRLYVGRWIDRFGCRPMWIIGSLIVAVTVGATQFTTQLWLITLLRAVSAMASAAVMTNVAVFAAQVAPPHRRAESIGTIGLAGFVGMMAGPTLGDWVFAGGGESMMSYHIFFSAGAACSLASAGAMFLIRLPKRPTSDDHQQHNAHETTSTSSPKRFALMITYWPGVVLLVALGFGVVFGFHSSFLERFAEAQGFEQIKVFFITYCPTAIVLRVVFRRLPQRIGRNRTVVVGLTLLIVGLMMMVGVDSQLGLILPGFFMGAGHCFIFPSMVDLAADTFPSSNRGTATALVLGAGDLGLLVGYLALGALIEVAGFATAIKTIVAVVGVCTFCFVVWRRKDLFHAGKRSRMMADPLVARRETIQSVSCSREHP